LEESEEPAADWEKKVESIIYDDEKILNYSVMMGFQLCRFSCVLSESIVSLSEAILRGIEKTANSVIASSDTGRRKKHGSLNNPVGQSYIVTLSDEEPLLENNQHSRTM
jgi:hypothetical protein